MNKISCTDGTRTFFTKIRGKLFETLCDICGDDTLFLDILSAPCERFALAIKLFPFEFHCACQSDCAPFRPLTIKKNLRSGSKPTARLWSIYKNNKQSGIHLAGAIKELHRLYPLSQPLISTARKDNFTEGIGLELGVIICKVDGIERGR